ncbi:MAG: HNH endonuclease, partial [Acidimicrobiia bacterium]|nr:HNH endonuclease [Acidimicrobiia bacterium]
NIATIRAHALTDIADTTLRREPSERSTPNRYSIALTLHPNPNSDGSETAGWTANGRLPPGATCDATFYRLVLDQPSEVLDVGRTTRSWDGPIATAIRQRDQTCRFPGCDQPPQRCDIHHCTPWEHGGQTTITNGILLCRHHHTFIHANNWHITLDHHQQPTFTKPDGTTNQPPRPPTWPPTKHPTDPPATDDDRTSGDERATGNDHGPSHRDRTSAR